MKRIIVLCIALLVLAGCGKTPAPQVQLDARAADTAAPTAATPAPTVAPATAMPTLVAEPDPTDEPVPADGPGATDVPFEVVEEPAPAAGFAEALAARWEAEGLLDGFYTMESEDALDYFGIDFSLCTGGAAFADALGYTNEALILEAEGPILDEAEALLRDHMEDMKNQFRSYDAAALALAEKAVLLREGNMVLYILSPQAEQMLAVYRSLKA